MTIFNIGDRTRLKSGGPLMTITEINGNIITCVWFEEGDTKNVNSKEFPSQLLLDEEV